MGVVAKQLGRRLRLRGRGRWRADARRLGLGGAPAALPLSLLVGALSACALDFDLSGRSFACPPEVTGCLECNPDGTCRLGAAVVSNDPPQLPTEPSPSKPEPTEPSPSEPKPSEPSPSEPKPSSPVDAGSPQEPGKDPAEPEPPEPDPPDPGPCAEFRSRASDSVCLDGADRCFDLGPGLSQVLTAWLDPTTLPQDGSRYWCDRSGKRHHAVITGDGEGVRVERDERGVEGGLGLSLLLDGGQLELQSGSEPVLSLDRFAILVAAAAPLDPSDGGGIDLFETGQRSRLELSILPAGEARGRISSSETTLVPDPVVTKSHVYDKAFHLYTLYRRLASSDLDDVLQLRLNGALEFRGSSIAIPRLLDLSSPQPRIGGELNGSGATPAGRGRVAAVLILRGSVPEDELARLETFLCQSLAVCAPGRDPDAEPADAGLSIVEVTGAP